MKISENKYLQGFCLVVIVLGIVRAVVPRVAMSTVERLQVDSIQTVRDSILAMQDSVQEKYTHADKDIQEDLVSRQVVSGKGNRFLNSDGTPARHRIVSVKSYAEAFPDSQSVQIVSAQKWGVTPVANRQEAEERKAELVYVGSNPYFFVEPLYWSIPYLVPRASLLLQDIGRNFIDSLQVKGLPAHKIIVTSVLRTKEEVARMRRYNGNVSENSCHMYGTTFDIAYNRYLRVEDEFQPYIKENTVADVRLKQILSEVLDDLRREGRCWVKYEVKQSCFHATVR